MKGGSGLKARVGLTERESSVGCIEEFWVNFFCK